jgi:hypothetical protein
MPWKECKPMDARLRFVARLLEGEKMSPLCREFGISRVIRTNSVGALTLPKKSSDAGASLVLPSA